MTKVAMAQVIIQALYNLPTPPSAKDERVIKRSKFKEWTLVEQHKAAVASLSKRKVA